MQHRNKHSHHNTILAGLTALLLLAFSPIRSDASEAEEKEPSAELFEIFLSGMDDERLEVAEDCDDMLEELIASCETSDIAVDWLTAALGSEPDPWIRFTCLLDLANYSSRNELTPLFVDLLVAGKPADRWPTVAWFTTMENAEALPHLQALWPATERPWLQPMLVRALANQQSHEHLEEFMALARKNEAGRRPLNRAAVRALAIMKDERAIPALLELSGTDGPLALRAIRALDTWPESTQAREGLLNLMKSIDSSRQVVALETLAEFDHPDVAQARLKLVEDLSAPRELRRDAISGLSYENDPAIFPLLRAIIAGDSPADGGLQRAALRTLRLNAFFYADEAALRFIQQFSDSSHLFPPVPDSEYTPPPPHAPRARLRVTPESGRSVRCWDGPDRIVPWDDVLTVRMPGGYPWPIGAVYEGAHGILVQNIDEDCWVPLENLAWRRPEPEERGMPFFWDSPTSADFDIPLDETYSETSFDLQDAGLLELFDPGPGTIGAALVIDEHRPEHRDLLLALSQAGDAPLLRDALAAAWGDLEEPEHHEP